jgi:predicted nucleic acid-binding protein
VKFYLDTSFILAVVIDDAHSEFARRSWNEISTDTVVSNLASIEFAAVVSRGVRTKALTEAGARTALDDFDLMRGNCGSHSLGGADYELALRLVRDFSTKLAAPDALHLASAINLGASLVTFDARLAEAARMRGARVAATC